ncbi:uncharacterized protein LOC116350852 [Contarinia nasturtii]|uniref:uncharacterized protein LOC116350852 n=1 Tax=Contarinia nasturtii TaxID=265458 RepID=UPI0012D3F53A|nr:uncharacterized protein LOC116350852 [Contarinia nasturtii]
MLPGNSVDIRRRQIDTLKIFNNNVTEIKANEEYSVGFKSDDRQMLLNVFLGPKFPNEKPKIVISPKIQHEWIADFSSGEIQTAPGLLNYTLHQDLGRVVQAIIREFEKFPPALWPNGSAMPQSTQSNLPEPNKSSIPELCNLSKEELQKLDKDPQYLSDFVDEMAIIQRLHNDLDTIIEDVKVVATENLTREQHMQQLRSAIEEMLNEFRKLGGSYESLSARYQKKSEEFAPQHIKELLQIAASNADGICDTYVQQFLNGSVDVQQFLDQYREAKQISAMRKAKEERLTHQLNELERATF